MNYVTYDYYKSLYGEIEESEFNLLSYDACRLADKATTGVDGIKKLKIAFPTDEDDAEALKRAICGVIFVMASVRESEKNMSGYTTNEDGTVRPNMVASVSSGSESVSFVKDDKTLAGSLAVSDLATRETTYLKMLTDNLRGVSDDNGINLVYMGFYPIR